MTHPTHSESAPKPMPGQSISATGRSWCCEVSGYHGGTLRLDSHYAPPAFVMIVSVWKAKPRVA